MIMYWNLNMNIYSNKLIMLCIDIIGLIFKYLNFGPKHSLKRMSRSTNKYLHIIDLWNIHDAYLRELSDDILLNYPYVTKLICDFNRKIKHVNHLKFLKELSICYNQCEIKTNKQISELNLIGLRIDNNDGISKFDHMTNLRYLSWRSSGTNYHIVNRKSLLNHNLELLIVSNYKVMFDIRHMNRLKYLNLNYQAIINDYDIENLDLEYLSMVCTGIIAINHLRNLKFLEVGGYMDIFKKIKYENIKDLHKLKSIYVGPDYNGDDIANLKCMKNIKVVYDNPDLIKHDIDIDEKYRDYVFRL